MKINFRLGEKLSAQGILNELMREKIISIKHYNSIINNSTLINEETIPHPFTLIALQNWHTITDTCDTITEYWLCQWLGKKLQINYFNLKKLRLVDNQLQTLLTKTYITNQSVIPILEQDNKILLATIEPLIALSLLSELRMFIKSALKKDCELSIVEPKYFKKVYARIFGSGRDRHIDELGEASFSSQAGGFMDISTSDPRYDPPVVRYVNEMLRSAFLKNASDIHLEPQGGTGKVRFRIDGVLQSTTEISEEKYRRAVAIIKVAAKMNIAERRRPQDGRLRIISDMGSNIELRISTMPCPFGEKMVLRIFDPDLLVLPLDKIGFTKEDKEVWDHMVNSPYGLIVVTGPTGSGKTTTLYSALGSIVSDEKNISTIEDPIEVIDKRFSQLQVDHSVGLTFPQGIKTLLRQDPDIIMIGEIRDGESADVSIQAALTGHLVLATLHTNDVPSTITRLLDLSVPPYLIKAALIGVVAQRLVRVLCPNCKRPIKTPKDDWEFITSPVRIKYPEYIYENEGCEKCNFLGFKGRTGIYEILYLVESVQRLITPAADSIGLRKAMIKAGMKPLRVSGALKVAEGVTTLDEIYKVIPNNLETI